MFKITIDNEEVITDKDFTIEEEMLNTPSVILNNVYPKEWEQDKDYLNFYHPNEYSKCKIFNEEITPASEGLTVEGTDFSITYDNTKEFNLLSLKGDTSQSGTPTPTSPIPVNTVTGRQQISVVGKNLFDKDDSNMYLNNIAPDNNGLMVSTSTDITATNYIRTLIVSCQPSTTYTIQKSASKTFFIYDSSIMPVLNTQTTYLSRNDTGNKSTITTSNNAKYLIVKFYNTWATESVPYQNMINSIQIELGSSATTYEAYKGHNYEIELGGSQLVNFSTLSNSNTTNSFSNDTLTVGTTSGTYANAFKNITDIYKGNAGRILRFDYDSLTATTNLTGVAGYVRLRIVKTNNSITNVNLVNTDKTISNYTIPSDISDISTVSLTIYANNTNASMTNTITIEKPILHIGGTKISYSTYNENPIELNNINDYQDIIFKNTPESDYYDNTLEEGAWYLLKRTGKVVLNGSETWTYSGTSTANVYRMQYNGINTLCLKPANADTLAQIVCDYYTTKTANQTYVKNIGISMNILGNILIYDSNYTSSDTTAFKTWLSSHNVSVYYVLETPTTELIEDTELLGQLEEVSLLEGINNISVSSPYLPSTMNLHYNFNDEIITEDLYFCGVVKNSGNISLNPREPHFQSLQVLSYKTFLSEGETLDFVIYQKTIREAIEQVVSAIQDYGFIVGDINILNPDEIIGAYSTKDKSAYDVFQYIADITQSRWTTRMVDEDTIAIDFYDPSLMQLGTTLDYTQEFFEDNLIDDMSYSYGTNDYRNKQIMTSQEVYSNINQIQNIVANGYQTQFNTEQQIGKINSIKVGGVDYTFATNTEKDMGVIADFYYSAGNNYFESASTVSIGTVIVIDYLPIVEGRQIITNSNEIDRVANSTGVKGVVARYENRNDATTSTELQLIGQSYIKYKGVPEIVLTVITRKNIWYVGQRVQFNAPINELATLYMVRKKAIHRITTIDTIFYTYELVSSFNSETAVNYFDNQRAKANGNIGEGEYISRNIDIQSTANIVFYDTQANEITVVGDNELNCTLESPFVS